MRDFRDAKAMARALRDALKTKSVETTHSESLELIAKAFGLENWNIMSTKIEAARSPAPSPLALASAGPNKPEPPATLFCTFCGKSQHDVRTLIAGPSSTYICDECVLVCNDVLDEKDDSAFFNLLAADAESGREDYPAASKHIADETTEDLMALRERCRRGVQRYRLALESIRQMLAIRDGKAQAGADVLASPRFSRLKDMSHEELLADRQRVERGILRYEQALGVAETVLGRRRQ